MLLWIRDFLGSRGQHASHKQASKSEILIRPCPGLYYNHLMSSDSPNQRLVFIDCPCLGVVLMNDALIFIRGKIKHIMFMFIKMSLKTNKVRFDLLVIKTAAAPRTNSNFSSSATASLSPTNEMVKLSSYVSSLDKIELYQLGYKPIKRFHIKVQSWLQIKKQGHYKEEASDSSMALLGFFEI